VCARQAIHGVLFRRRRKIKFVSQPDNRISKERERALYIVPFRRPSNKKEEEEWI